MLRSATLVIWSVLLLGAQATITREFYTFRIEYPKSCKNVSRSLKVQSGAQFSSVQSSKLQANFHCLLRLELVDSKYEHEGLEEAQMGYVLVLKMAELDCLVASDSDFLLQVTDETEKQLLAVGCLNAKPVKTGGSYLETTSRNLTVLFENQVNAPAHSINLFVLPHFDATDRHDSLILLLTAGVVYTLACVIRFVGKMVERLPQEADILDGECGEAVQRSEEDDELWSEVSHGRSRHLSEQTSDDMSSRYTDQSAEQY